MDYFISVEIEATILVADLKAAIQQAFDNGAAGDFQILTTQAPSFVVLFKRNTIEDQEYVSSRAKNGSVTIERAAMQQLSAELKEGCIGLLAMDVVYQLDALKAQCFDFCIGAMEEMAEYSPDAEEVVVI